MNNKWPDKLAKISPWFDFALTHEQINDISSRASTAILQFRQNAPAADRGGKIHNNNENDRKKSAIKKNGTFPLETIAWQAI